MTGKRNLGLHGFRVTFAPVLGFAVEDADGKRVSGGCRSRTEADRLRMRLQGEADAKAGRCQRPCLCCKATFTSHGSHNRLCGTCRKADAGPVALAFARPQRRGDGAAR